MRPSAPNHSPGDAPQTAASGGLARVQAPTRRAPRLVVPITKPLRALIAGGAAVASAATGVQLSRLSSLMIAPAVAANPPARSGRAQGHVGAAEIAPLLDELIDAHADTVQLASGLAADPYWGAHLQYPRALQRAGSETLARMSLKDAA